MNELAGSAVALWTLSLTQPSDVAGRLERLLSPDEAARAARFVFERDRVRFVTCRAALRILIGRYLGTPPESVSFTYGPQGKPAVAGSGGRLAFNLAHAGDLAVLGFATAGPLGVDLEYLDRRIDVETLAGRFFAPDEARELRAVPPEQRREAFFNGWTRKEAFIKATGDGLSRPLDSFSVTLRPGEPARIRRIDGDDPASWSLMAFEPAGGYLGAMATPWRPAPVRVIRWSPAPDDSGPTKA